MCDLVTFLRSNPEVYREQYELAVQNIQNLVRTLPREELAEVCKVDEPDTVKVGEYSLAEVLANDRRN